MFKTKSFTDESKYVTLVYIQWFVLKFQHDDHSKNSYLSALSDWQGTELFFWNYIMHHENRLQCAPSYTCIWYQRM